MKSILQQQSKKRKGRDGISIGMWDSCLSMRYAQCLKRWVWMLCIEKLLLLSKQPFNDAFLWFQMQIFFYSSQHISFFGLYYVMISFYLRLLISPFSLLSNSIFIRIKIRKTSSNWVLHLTMDTEIKENFLYRMAEWQLFAFVIFVLIFKDTKNWAIQMRKLPMKIAL